MLFLDVLLVIFKISCHCAHRSRHYNSQDAVLQQAKLFLMSENNQMLERHTAQRQAQASSLFSNQEGAFNEDMMVGRNRNPCQSLRFC